MFKLSNFVKYLMVSFANYLKCCYFFFYFWILEYEMRPKIKYRLFLLSDRPTKIAATQNILLPHLRKKYFFKMISFLSYLSSVEVSDKFAIKH
jgi:hypothetical protein